MSLKIIVSFQLLAVKIATMALQTAEIWGEVSGMAVGFGCSGAGTSGSATEAKHKPALGHGLGWAAPQVSRGILGWTSRRARHEQL